MSQVCEEAGQRDVGWPGVNHPPNEAARATQGPGWHANQKASVLADAKAKLPEHRQR